MKNTNMLIAPLFAFVVVLLSVGAVGELFSSLFAKLTNKETDKELSTQTALEAASQLR